MSAHRLEKRRCRRPEHGLTIVEVLVSIAVFGICIPVLLGAMLFCYSTTKINAHKMTALTLAQKKIENLMNLKFASLSTTAHAYDENNVPLDSAGSLRGNVAAVVTSDGSQRKKITVAVKWNECRRNLNVALDTLVSDNIVTKP
ncbi:MAG: prepilin-type N-terminal cleavage/methylation domain-containing protein [Candidatus Aureabacteria bacterium]|nr:prepilin-type N-terminal cleavage/methylation domain-containing protein [Candidatus Auribacterota bacterium]